jgi:hypothetical protein
MRDFQLFMLEARGAEEIKEKAVELFANPYVAGAQVLDMDIYEKVILLQDYSDPIGALLGVVGPLSRKDADISDELREEIMLYLRTKSRDPFIIPSNIKIEGMNKPAEEMDPDEVEDEVLQEQDDDDFN